jgi:dipeptide/tripeptide permease
MAPGGSTKGSRAKAKGARDAALAARLEEMEKPTGIVPAVDVPGMGMAASLRSFGRAFWLINTIEMLERGAYYGIISVLAIHLVNQGIPLTTVGVGIGILQALLYFVPLFAAALAEKYGYQKGLVAAFACGLVGYLGLAALGAFALLGPWAMLPGIVLLGVGSGTFKPIAAAAIARATTPEQRNLGFTIYYAGVNVGGFLGPLLIGLFVPEALYGIVFYGAAAVIATNLAVSLLVYRDPVPPQKEKSVTQALRMLVELRKDPLYLALLLFYSAFWFVYAQQQFFLPVYARDYLNLGLNPALVATINPATIILFGPVLGKLTERKPSLPLIVAGAFIYILGYLMVGLFLAPLVFVAGVVLFSVGEVLVQPSFLSYSSKIAPKDRVAVYLGYSFLPVGIGLVLGATAGGVMYHQ